MKIKLSDRRPITGPDNHQIRELVGLATLNVAKYSVAHIVASAGSEGVSRTNEFDEILLVISGKGHARLDHVSYELEPQDLLLLPEGTRYAINADEAEDLVMWAICVPAFRPDASRTGSRRDWRDYQVPRGADRLRPRRDE